MAQTRLVLHSICFEIQNDNTNILHLDEYCHQDGLEISRAKQIGNVCHSIPRLCGFSVTNISDDVDVAKFIMSVWMLYLLFIM